MLVQELSRCPSKKGVKKTGKRLLHFSISIELGTLFTNFDAPVSTERESISKGIFMMPSNHAANAMKIAFLRSSYKPA